MRCDHNVDQLRADIDSGRSGDKIAWPDPATAPLGTDDEAAGTPPTRDQVERAHRQEVGRPVASSAPEGRGLGQGWWMVAITILMGVFIVAVPLFLR